MDDNMKNLFHTIMASMQKGADPDDILEMSLYCTTARRYDSFLWPILDVRMKNRFLFGLFPNQSPEASAGEAAREQLFRDLQANARSLRIVRPMRNLCLHFSDLMHADPRRRLPMHRYVDIISELGLLVLDNENKEELFAHFVMVGEMSFQSNTNVKNAMLTA